MIDAQTLNIRPPLWLPVAVAVLLGGAFVWGKSIESRDHTPTMINVSGEGKVSAAPDIAELSLGVTTGRQPTATQAKSMLDEKMNAVFDAVKEVGIPEKDIRTEQLSLNPAYDWKDGQQTLRGYEATESLRVKVRDLDNVSDVLQAATLAGANQAGGVAFTFDDPEKPRAQAREGAIEQAQSKAAVLARQLGMRLGRIRSFNEGGGISPPVPMYARGLEMAGDTAMEKSLPVPEGEQEVRVEVSLTYELE
ncbi:MAG: hypothetical protein Greene041619_99 [Candidatus Peregrinibacteria bacterium Greene0416_19]|nr:MAG: hypothetical protein Greene041619_99 [Candidatus Peregrinibacteria bacterium Greene0416_19]